MRGRKEKRKGKERKKRKKKKKKKKKRKRKKVMMTVGGRLVGFALKSLTHPHSSSHTLPFP
jgi:hypothetical protein